MNTSQNKFGIQVFFFIFIFCALLQGVPLKTLSTLPLTGNDLLEAKKILKN